MKIQSTISFLFLILINYAICNPYYQSEFYEKAKLMKKKLNVQSEKPIEESNNKTSNNRNETLYVHMIAHTHDDIGWLKTIDEYFTGSN